MSKAEKKNKLNFQEAEYFYEVECTGGWRKKAKCDIV